MDFSNFDAPDDGWMQCQAVAASAHLLHKHASGWHKKMKTAWKRGGTAPHSTKVQCQAVVAIAYLLHKSTVDGTKRGGQDGNRAVTLILFTVAHILLQ